jgi:hypothetical protein
LASEFFCRHKYRYKTVGGDAKGVFPFHQACFHARSALIRQGLSRIINGLQKRHPIFQKT